MPKQPGPDRLEELLRLYRYRSASIDEFIQDLGGQIDGLLDQRMRTKLDALVAHRDQLPPKRRRALIRALRRHAAEVEAFASDLKRLLPISRDTPLNASLASDRNFLA